MGKYMRAISIFLICICGGLSIALLAMTHHGAVPADSIETLNTAALMQLFGSLLAVTIISSPQSSKFVSNIVMGGVGFSTITFFIPICLLGFGIITTTPTAPFGGIVYILVWAIVAFGLAKQQLKKRND